jgi:hypothetical protein
MSHECKYCNYSTNYPSYYKKHVNSKKHQNVIDAIKNLEIQSNDNLGYPRVSVATRGYNVATINYAVDTIENKKVIDDSDKDEVYNDKNIDANECEYCGVIIKDNSNYYKHSKKCYFKNIKEITNMDKSSIHKLIKNLVCPLCKYNTSRHSSLARHVKSCINNKTVSVLEVIKLKHENEIEIYKEKLKAKEEIVKAKEEINTILTEQNKNTNTLAVGNMCNVNGMIETNMRSITFLNKFMNNAPCLEHFNTEFKDPYIFYIDYDEHKKLKKECKLENSKENILYYDEDKMTKDDFIADHIFFLQRNKQTVKFIVERLLYFYKKEGDSIKQSIWNIDMYRYNFTICLKTGNKTLWHSDKQGQTTTEMILDPLLSFTSGIVQKHLETLQEDMQNLAKQKKTNEMLSLLKKVETLTEFTISVKNKDLQQEIIRKLSPLLFFDPNKHTEVLQIEE